MHNSILLLYYSALSPFLSAAKIVCWPLMEWAIEWFLSGARRYSASLNLNRKNLCSVFFAVLRSGPALAHRRPTALTTEPVRWGYSSAYWIVCFRILFFSFSLFRSIGIGLRWMQHAKQSLLGVTYNANKITPHWAKYDKTKNRWLRLLDCIWKATHAIQRIDLWLNLQSDIPARVLFNACATLLTLLQLPHTEKKEFMR